MTQNILTCETFKCLYTHALARMQASNQPTSQTEHKKLIHFLWLSFFSFFFYILRLIITQNCAATYSVPTAVSKWLFVERRELMLNMFQHIFGCVLYM